MLSEAGGHRWQRVPPTERRRVHTNTVTVAAFEGRMDTPRPATLSIRDVRERITRGQGPCGQNRNRNAPTQDTQPSNSMSCGEYAYSNSYSWRRSTPVDTLPP